jgi:hypothetical protein
MMLALFVHDASSAMLLAFLIYHERLSAPVHDLVCLLKLLLRTRLLHLSHFILIVFMIVFILAHLYSRDLTHLFLLHVFKKYI